MADLTAYPVIFSGPMVRAILDGRKTQTRRLAWNVFRCPLDDWDKPWRNPTPWYRRYEKFQAGERPWLWAKETWGDKDADHPRCIDGRKPLPGDRLVFRANPGDDAQWSAAPGHPGLADFVWRPSIHMPKWASRLSLEVTDMKIERLQDISEEDAGAEGCILGPPPERDDWGWIGAPGLPDRFHASEAFRDLWNSIHGPDAWAQNPEVVAVTFKIHKQNIDAIRAGRAALKESE